jgi:hypothetical protein
MSPKFDLEERLAEAKQRGVGVDMAVPLHERIEQLCELVYAAGSARPSKGKMFAALVLGSPTAPDELDGLLRAYDGARVRDALVTSKPDATVVEFPHRRSGPRPKSSR